MMKSEQSCQSRSRCALQDLWASEPQLIALLARRSHEGHGVTSGFWRGIRLGFFVIAPGYFLLLGICWWLR